MEAVQKFDAKIISAKVILLDIEGTTTSKSFVKDTLFPYAVENVSSFLTSNWEIEEVKTVVTALRELASKDKTDAVEGCIEILEEAEDNRDSVIKSVVDNVKWQISLDRKTGPLKTLQGLIWEKGYKDGTIKGHVYDDVPEALSTWSSSGHRLYVYSSGSVAAQKLLFGHTEKGSLLDNFSGYFDTSVGGKQEAESYKTISKEIDSDRILFLTDIVKEAEAAVEAGLSVVLVDRDTDSSLSDEERQKYAVITSFADLPLSVTGGKRKSIDNTEEELPPAKVAKTDEATETADSTEVSSAMETEEKTDQVKDESVSKPIVEEVQTTDVPKANETEKPEESNDVEAMEVDSVSSNTKETPVVVNEVPECDSTDMKSGETKTAPEVAETVKEVVKTDAEVPESKVEEVTESKVEEVTESKIEVAESKLEVSETKVEEVSTTKVEEVAESKTEVTDSKTEVAESKMEEVTESEVTNGTEDKKETSECELKEAVESKKDEVTQSKPDVKEEIEAEKAEVSVDSETKENGETKKEVEDKTEKEITNVEQNGTTDEKVNNDETKTAKTDENEVSTTDAKSADQADHALKESNGIETNGTNGTIPEDVIETKKPEENGVSSDMVESSTNGTDSDKENDKEEDKKTEVTNGATEEACDVKVKKIQADSSPVPAPVEEISA